MDIKRGELSDKDFKKVKEILSNKKFSWIEKVEKLSKVSPKLTTGLKSTTLTQTFSTPVRVEIINYLIESHFEGKKDININEIQREVNERFVQDYTWTNYKDHIKVLEYVGLIKTHREKKKKGQPRIVNLNLEMFPIKIVLGEKEVVLFDTNISNRLDSHLFNS